MSRIYSEGLISIECKVVVLFKVEEIESLNSKICSVFQSHLVRHLND